MGRDLPTENTALTANTSTFGDFKRMPSKFRVPANASAQYSCNKNDAIDAICQDCTSRILSEKKLSFVAPCTCRNLDAFQGIKEFLPKILIQPEF